MDGCPRTAGERDPGVWRLSVTQGRRFNGRPAVSKTASGGSNPSAPANHPSQSVRARTGRIWQRKRRILSIPRETMSTVFRVEMRRVTWPSRKQVESTTAVVIISVFAFAGYFAVVDTVLSRAVKGVLNYFTKDNYMEAEENFQSEEQIAMDEPEQAAAESPGESEEAAARRGRDRRARGRPPSNRPPNRPPPADMTKPLPRSGTSSTPIRVLKTRWPNR